MKTINEKNVTIFGTGYMGSEYAKACKKLGLENVEFVCRHKESAESFQRKFGYKTISGGLSKYIDAGASGDLAVIATPVEQLTEGLKKVITSDFCHILVEKPVALDSAEINQILNLPNSNKVKVAYNRVNYPSVRKLITLAESDGGITSASFEITEWSHKIDENKFSPEVLKKWGIANTSHVLSIIQQCMGTLSVENAIQADSLSWHPSGAVFCGSGRGKSGAPFSYFGNWKSAGRWGCQVHTERGCYRLIPLEELYFCKKGTIKWEKIEIDSSYTGVKDGVCEQLLAALGLNTQFRCPNLAFAASLTRASEKIFGYSV